MFCDFRCFSNCVSKIFISSVFWLVSEYNRFLPMDLVNCDFAQVLIAVFADSVGFSAHKVVSRAPQDHPQVPGLPGRTQGNWTLTVNTCKSKSAKEETHGV